MPLAFVLSTFTTLALNGIWIAILISHIVACIAAILTGCYRIKKYLDDTKREQIYVRTEH